MAATPGVQIAVTGIQPTVLRPGDDLTVTARLTNTTTSPVAQPLVQVRLRRSGFISRSSLDLWRNAGPDQYLGSTVLATTLDAPLEAGASTTVTLTVPAASIGLSHTAWNWGARGLGLELVDGADPARPMLGVARTFVVWFPEQTVSPTTVSMLVPVTGPAPDATAAEQVSSLTSAGGRLESVLEATGDRPDVSWAVDPWLVKVAADGWTNPLTPEADVAARTLAGRRRMGQTPWCTTRPGREVALLPWGDADVAALTHDGATAVLASAESRSRSVAAELGLPGSTSLVLPGDPVPDLPTAGTAAAAGQALVVGPGELEAPAVLTYAPSDRADVTTARGDATVLVPDQRLSDSLTTGWVLGAGATAAALTPATAAADLLAELAVITRERPADPRHLLITVPRGWDPDVAVVQAQLDAIDTAPWVQMAPLSTLTALTPTIERGTLPDRTVGPTEVTASQLTTVVDATERRKALAVMATRPEELLGDLQAERLVPASLAWRAEPAARAAVVQASVDRTQAIAGSVTVPDNSPVNLISTSGDLPLRVDNSLDQAVTLKVRLRPSNARLVAREAVTVTVPANGEATVRIPVHGVQSADVVTTVELLTPDGVTVDDATTMTVRVRAEWEGIGTAVVGGLLALGLVVGLFRTIRRGRGRGRVRQRPDAPDDPSETPQAAHAAGGVR